MFQRFMIHVIANIFSLKLYLEPANFLNLLQELLADELNNKLLAKNLVKFLKIYY